MPYETGFDLLNKNLEKALKTNADSQKARQDLHNSLLLAKVKAQQEASIKSGEMKDKFGYDLAMEKEKASMPFKAYQEFQSGQGNPGGAPNVTMGPDAKMRVLKLKDMAEQIYMKPPNTWSQQEKQIVEQYKAFAQATRPPQGGGFKPMYDEGGETPTGMPSSPATTLPQGITEEDIAHTMKLHSLTRGEVLSRIK